MNQLTRIINNKNCNNKAVFCYMYWGLVVPEKTLESLWDSKIKPVNPKGNQPWILLEELMLKLKLQSIGHLM